jgi:hypothetical protein
MISEKQLKQKHSEEFVEIQRQLKEKDQILENYKKEHGKLELFFSHIYDTIRPVMPINQSYRPSKKSTSPCIAVMQISDGHMGSVQNSDEIEDFGGFSPDICESRQIDYAQRFIQWVEMHRGAYNIPECAIIVTGDMISGDIHDELKITNAFPSPVQCVKAAEVLVKQIALVAPCFEKVTVHFVVEDNHARLTKKPQCKEAGYNSLNYIVGKIASIYLEKQKNVEFNIYPQYEKVVNVNGRQYLICHGHGVMGWGGIPFYGIERKVGKESQARLQVIMEDQKKAKYIGFHKYVFGHFHTPFDMLLYSCCGSVSGTDAYDHKAGRYAKPSQSSWMVHPKHGEFNRINFQL